MAGVGDCGGALSKEHYVSRAILETFAKLNVEGLRGVEDGAARPVGVGSLTAKVLCSRHNSMLSGLDNDAAELFKRLRGIMEGRANIMTELAERENDVLSTMHSGDLVERWILKAGCGMLAGGVVPTAAELKRGWRPPRSWLEVVAGLRSLQSPLGLYVLQAEEGAPVPSARVQFSPMTDQEKGHVLGIRVALSWVRFFLCLTDEADRVEEVLERAVWRPRGLYFQAPGREAMAYLAWPDGSSSREVSYRPHLPPAVPC